MGFVRKHCVGLFFSLLAGLTPSGFAAGDTLLHETFDDTNGFTSNIVVAESLQEAGDYFALSYGPTTNDEEEKKYTGVQGRYLTGMDIDGISGVSSGDLPATVTWTVDISGHNNLSFRGWFAEFIDGTGHIDATDELKVTYSIDGKPKQDLIDFDGSTVNGVSAFRLVTSDGSLSTSLGSGAQEFIAPITDTGDTLTLQLIVSVDASHEDFAVDDFILTGDLIPEPTTALALLTLPFLTRRRGHRDPGKDIDSFSGAGILPAMDR
jgi:hypothetical protein